jgi:nitroimidazol reductase NimA-like FMN-containing flavoprotein (pyridoxamine 5'-phosphate oxidase superfamily)
MERRPSALRELSRARCLDLLSTATVGRVGLSVRALPVILPVGFILAGERVIFRSAPGVKLDAARHRHVVAFEADGFEPHRDWGWSVLVQGMASEVQDPAELAAVHDLLAGSGPAVEDGGTARLVAIEATFVTGRAFGSIPGPVPRC